MNEAPKSGIGKLLVDIMDEQRNALTAATERAEQLQAECERLRVALQESQADARKLWERLHYESGRCFVGQLTYDAVEKYRAKYGGRDLIYE